MKRRKENEEEFENMFKMQLGEVLRGAAAAGERRSARHPPHTKRKSPLVYATAIL